MRRFIESSSRKQIVQDNPYAAKIVKVLGGYIVFDIYPDYETWKKQK